MGLMVDFDPFTFGYPAIVEKEISKVGEDGTELYGYGVAEVDYSLACQVFVETFISIARELVPVDTGYLRSTIDASTDGWNCSAVASAEYAEYVEYGTWRMRAQPYFEPALEEAMLGYHQECEIAVMLANMEARASALEQVSDDMEGFDFMGGGLSLIFLLILFFPIALIGYGIYRSLVDALGITDQDIDDNYSFGEFGLPEIIIIG